MFVMLLAIIYFISSDLMITNKFPKFESFEVDSVDEETISSYLKTAHGTKITSYVFLSIHLLFATAGLVSTIWFSIADRPRKTTLDFDHHRFKEGTEYFTKETLKPCCRLDSLELPISF